LTTREALTCTECDTGFVLGAGDMFSNGTKRGAAVRVREYYTVTCSGCGEPLEIPFQLRGDKPAYCNDCRSRKR